MRSPKRRRYVLASLLALLFVTGSVVAPQAARPAQAIPPYWECNSDGEVGRLWTEWISVASSDYIVWECEKGPYFGYWWRIADIRNAEDDAKAFSENWKKFVQDEVYQGLVDIGLGLIDLDGNPSNDNLDSVVSFTLHGPSGSPIFRTLGARILVGYSRYSSGPFSACSDTGWLTSNPDVSAFSTKLQYGNGGKCGTGFYRLQGSGRFLSQSTGSWVTMPWVYSSPLYVYGPV
ncbi:MAG TPA: hypothetical protein VFM55_09525 [Micromonosporaceae bacterium]|nr:hypothetical protein [Micromonosporaceae bacterium]